MMDTTAAAAEFKPNWFHEKLFLGMTFKDYLRSNFTLFNAVAGLILAVGIPVIVYRLLFGLGPSTNLSDNNPWGIWIGFDMLCGVGLAAGGFVIGTAVHLLGMKEYGFLFRPAVLTGFLGYLFAIIALTFDLGRYYRIPYPMFVSWGVNSVLFLVAWHVALYLTCQFVEWCPAIWEWLHMNRLRRIFMKATVGATIFGVCLSMLHQSALGSIFLLMPSKLHPLWYSEYIPLWFFMSAIVGGLAMTIIESMASHRIFAGQIKNHDPELLNRVTLGLGKATSVTLFAYFFMKVVGLAHGNTWAYLATGYGYWFLLEILGFVLLPAFALMYAVQNGSVRMVRGWAIVAAFGIILNRLNHSIIAFNWHLPWEYRYVPHWMEVVLTITIVTIGVLSFQWIINRMPILYDHPDFEPEDH
jgi:Ni/Fe-hydrogenase subunit HybB-like protein